VIRLARFNVEQAGRAKTHFHGLPSPAAGMTLASYYPFSQSSLYTETIIGDMPWHMTMRFVMVALAFLMVSDVAYPAVPTIGYRTPRQIMGSIIVAGSVIGVFVLRLEFFFPALALYIAYGVIKTVLLGLIERRGAAEELLEEEEIDGVAVVPPHPHPSEQETAFDLSQGGRRRRRRGRRRTDPAPNPPPMDSGRESGA
jgi:CDP-diacylglycerol--serine O-phosphatidyltransferase